MLNPKVGMLVIAKNDKEYGITNTKALCKVTKVFKCSGRNMEVKVVSHRNSDNVGDEYMVESINFNVATPERIEKFNRLPCVAHRINAKPWEIFIFEKTGKLFSVRIGCNMYKLTEIKEIKKKFDSMKPGEEIEINRATVGKPYLSRVFKMIEKRGYKI